MGFRFEIEIENDFLKWVWDWDVSRETWFESVSGLGLGETNVGWDGELTF